MMNPVDDPNEPTTTHPLQHRPSNPPVPVSPQYYSPTVGPPLPMPVHMQVQQPVTDKSKRFLNLSTSALVLVITTILLVCCIGPVALCFLGGFVSAFDHGSSTPAAVMVAQSQVRRCS